MPRLRDYWCVTEIDLSDMAKSDTARWLVLRRAEHDRLMLDWPGGMCFDHGKPLPGYLQHTVSLLRDELLLDVVERTHDNGSCSLAWCSPTRVRGG